MVDRPGDEIQAAYEDARARYIAASQAEQEAKQVMKTAARAMFENANLPALQGTEKQITWANDIRLDVLAEIVVEAEALAELDVIRLRTALIQAARPYRNAAWWINMRDHAKFKIASEAGRIHRGDVRAASLEAGPIPDPFASVEKARTLSAHRDRELPLSCRRWASYRPPRRVFWILSTRAIQPIARVGFLRERQSRRGQTDPSIWMLTP